MNRTPAQMRQSLINYLVANVDDIRDAIQEPRYLVESAIQDLERLLDGAHQSPPASQADDPLKF